MFTGTLHQLVLFEALPTVFAAKQCSASLNFKVCQRPACALSPCTTRKSLRRPRPQTIGVDVRFRAGRRLWPQPARTVVGGWRWLSAKK